MEEGLYRTEGVNMGEGRGGKITCRLENKYRGKNNLNGQLSTFFVFPYEGVRERTHLLVCANFSKAISAKSITVG